MKGTITTRNEVEERARKRKNYTTKYNIEIDLSTRSVRSSSCSIAICHRRLA